MFVGSKDQVRNGSALEAGAAPSKDGAAEGRRAQYDQPFETRRPGSTPSRKSVLVVEDDPAVRQVIEEIIATLGLFSVNANSASEALASFKLYAADTVCVFLDYGVPGMHALQLLARFKELRADIPIILSSGYPESYINNDMSTLGVDGFIAKPFDSKTLIGTLQRVIAKNGNPG